MDQLTNVMEIIVSRYGKNSPEKVSFEDLHDIRTDLRSLMLLWNTNCYYVNCTENAFLINGGRSLKFPNIEGAEIDYRRRTTMKVSAGDRQEAKREVSWLIGIKSTRNDESVYIEVSQTGESWNWRNTL